MGSSRPGSRAEGALARALSRADRGRRWRAFGLAAPLLLFLLFTFVAPIGLMLFRSVDDPEVAAVLPETVAALAQWDGRAAPDEPVYAALAVDLARAHREQTVAIAGKRLGDELTGFRGVLGQSAREMATRPGGPYKPRFAAIDPRWVDRETWVVLRRASGPLTLSHLLAALDRRRDVEGRITPISADQAIYVDALGRTFWVALQVTALCLVLGYPVAFLLASLSRRRANALLILVLLPFWTSILVRTTAWIVLLQTEGVVNDVAVWTGLWTDRAQLIFNRTGVLTAMTHVLLPFMVLPLYSVMKGIPPAYVRAARSLGAGPFTAFRRVYLPQTYPGIAAGGLLVFILAIGYYITPALVGGPRDQLTSYFVALHTDQTLNWGLASALGAILLVVTLGLYLVFTRVTSVDRLRLG